MSALVEFITRYEPDFPNEIKGASDEKIGRLEELAGTLPELLIEVLKAMGEDCGGFNYAWDAWITVDELIKCYEDDLELVNVHGEEGTIPEDSVLIGWGNGLMSEAVVVKREGGEFGKVYLGDFDFSDKLDGRDVTIIPVADSLYGFLYQMAFQRFVLNNFTYRKDYVLAGRKTLPEIDALYEDLLALMERLNYEKQDYSDTRHYCGLTTDSAVVILKRRVEVFTDKESINIAFSTASEELMKIHEEELTKLGFSDYHTIR